MTVNTKTWMQNKDEKPGEEHQIFTALQKSFLTSLSTPHKKKFESIHLCFNL
jgi:hypothetical protein